MDKFIDNIWNIFHSPRFKSWAIGNLITKTNKKDMVETHL